MARPRRTMRGWLLAAVIVLAVSAFAVYQLVTTEPSPARTLVTWFWQLDYRLFPVEGGEELEELHRTASRESREQCIACHDDKSNSKLVLHRIHLTNPLLSRLQCHDCHQRVELTERGNRAVVTWVDVGFCKQCHSAFPGLLPGSKMKPEYFEQDCTRCHRGDEAPEHAQPYLPESILPGECKGCHGGRVLPSTSAHERRDWLEVHGMQALEAGADSCYQCHDFGLKFCDDCHSEKPPSHLPAERWRTIHSDEARADTRVCYACHKTSYCKSCHLKHEEGWLERHSEFVAEEGDSSCRECHSESACGYCHMLVSGSADANATETR